VGLTLALSGSFVQLATLGVITRLIVYISTCAALPVLRFRKDIPAPAYRLRFGALVSTSAIALCIWMLTNTNAQEIALVSLAASVGLVLYLLRAQRFPAL